MKIHCLPARLIDPSNHSNQFIGTVWVDGIEHAFIGEFVPEPSSLLLFSTGLSVLLTPGTPWVGEDQHHAERDEYISSGTSHRVMQELASLWMCPIEITGNVVLQWSELIFRSH